MGRVTVPGAASAGGRDVELSARAGHASAYPFSLARLAPAHLVAGLVGVAFVARLAIRLRGGEEAFLATGYSLYLEIANNLLQGRGFCLDGGLSCALRLPVYPAFIAPWMASGWLYPGLAIAQAALGAALVWVAWRIACDLFDARAGVIAAALTALSPYALQHDTGIQDTVLVNFLVGVTAYLLWQTRHRGAPAICLAAGLALAVALLTTGRLALAAPAVIVWALFGAGPTVRTRLRSAALIGLPVALLLGAWIARNASVVGAPVLTTESGHSLWVANNAWAMAHFPAESIDLSVRDSHNGMSPAERAAFERVSSNEVARDRLLRTWAVEYIQAHPGLTITNGVRKVWVAISAELSPARSAVLRWGYLAVFAPIHLLAAIGLWQQRHAWRAHSLTAAILLAFGATTAVFWAHTSHKSYLDMFLFVYAGAVGRNAWRAA